VANRRLVILRVCQKPQLLWMRNGERIEKSRLCEGEDCRIGANSRCQRNDRDCRYPGPFGKDSNGEMNVLPNSGKPQNCARLAMTLLKQRGIAELTAGCKNCLRSSHTAAYKTLGEQVEVRFDFIAELAIRLGLAKEASHS
jgi:hypothetical protein